MQSIAIQPKQQNLAAKPLSYAIPEKLCLAGTVALSVLSLMPPYRLASAIALRTVAFLTAATSSLPKAFDKASTHRALPLMKLTAISLAIVGVAAASPMAALASMVGDIGYHTFEAAKAFYNNEVFEGIAHCTVTVIDSLVLTGIALGSLPFMISAAAVSAATMAFFAGMSFAKGKVFNGICYLALMILGVATALKITEQAIPHRVKFEVRNNTDGPMSFYNRRGELIETIQPGELRHFNVATVDTRGGCIFYSKTEHVPFLEGLAECNPIFKNSCGGRWIDYVTPDWSAGKTITREALAPQLFPTLPLGGTAIAARETILLHTEKSLPIENP